MFARSALGPYRMIAPPSGWQLPARYAGTIAVAYQQPSNQLYGLGGLGGPVAGRPAGGVPPYMLSRFQGSPHTLEKMREQAWGPRGEQSFFVRQLTEEIVADLWPKDYLSEILAIRNFANRHLRYLNDPKHVELIKDPQRIVEELVRYGVALTDCDETAQFIATLAMQLGRDCEFVVVGFGPPGQYSHVFTRVREPKSGIWICCDPIAGTDERGMLERVTTYELWSLDEYEAPQRRLAA